MGARDARRIRVARRALLGAIALTTVALPGRADAAPGDPNVTITAPAARQTVPAGQPLQIRGEATDDVGVSRVSIAIRRADNLWLRSNGTWGAFMWLNTSLATPGAPSSAWTYTWTAPPSGSYGINAQAWDGGNRVDPTRPWVNFTVSTAPTDTTRPSVTISSPATNASLPLATITTGGSASDNVGVSAVELAIRNRATNQYDRGDGTWGAITYFPATLASPGAGTSSWSTTWTPSSAGDYAFGARSRDAAGNVSTTTWRNFSVYGGQCPTVTTYPIGSAAYEFDDTSRNRSFDTTVYYPAAPGTSGSGAPAGCGEFPVVVVGHGGSGTGASAAQLHRFLTQAGYIVVGPTLPAGFEYDELTADVSFVIDEILQLGAAGPGPLAGHVDADNIGYIGTSKGGMLGMALFQACCIDPRIDAVVSKIGVAPSGTYDWPNGPALLMLNGTEDTTAPYDEALEDYTAASPPKGLIRLEGVDHTLDVGNSSLLQETPLGFFGFFLKGQANGLQRVQNSVDATPIASLLREW